MFVGLLLNLLLFSLFVLSVIVMYNTKLIGIEQTTFDFGILRTLGITEANVLFIIASSSPSILLLASGLAYVFAKLMLGVLTDVLANVLHIYYKFDISFQGVAVSLFVAVLVPLVSSLWPAAQINQKPIL